MCSFSPSNLVRVIFPLPINAALLRCGDCNLLPLILSAACPKQLLFGYSYLLMIHLYKIINLQNTLFFFIWIFENNTKDHILIPLNHFSTIVKKALDGSAQPASNILGMFADCFLNATMFWKTREHLGNILKENIFQQILDRKVVFVLQMYDLTKKNIDLLANFSIHKAISVWKIFEGYSRNIVRL